MSGERRMNERTRLNARSLCDLLGPRPAQQRRYFGRVREARYLRPGLRPLSRHHAIWPRRWQTMILPGRLDQVEGRA